MATGICRPEDISKWEREVDVIVVGLGAAGAAVALEASAAGAETLVLERAGGGGGTSALSGGVLYLGGGTALQKACGFEDSQEEMFKYLLATVGEAPDEEKLRLYCEQSCEHYDWLVAQGVPFNPVFYYGCSGEPPTTDGLVWSGSERSYPYCEIAKPAPRGHVPARENVAGPLLMQKLCEAVDASPAEVATNHRCVELVQEADGLVVGVVAQTLGERRAFRARRGVVLTTGGFILEDRMLDKYMPFVKGVHLRVAADGDDGSGIRLGIAAGASTSHMDKASISLPVTQPWGLKRGILVNARGQRFVDESCYYGDVGEAALYHNDGHAWLIVDDEIFEQPEYPPREVSAVGESPAELERELGLPEGSLEATLALYNRHAESKSDPVFHKTEEYVQPIVNPPFGAFDCNVESSLYAAFTLGGLECDIDGRILDPEGNAIAGLYGAGRATSALSTGGYSSGLSLGDGTFFGRRAGRAAAAG
ncbi:MAG: FAD-dependent oxidoreductase [Deltaproteobacteria bacterium]|nr:FAD-dependent oxidoreductase [Deltaproteobacteria bacterium]MBW2360712.1 FAD-dependent oxidoreductase [Deltaproteobacteria bacterium]